MWRENEVAYDLVGKYTTDIITEEALSVIENHNQSKPLYLQIAHLAPHAANRKNPLQAPQEILDKFTYIKDPRRRAYAGKESVKRRKYRTD